MPTPEEIAALSHGSPTAFPTGLPSFAPPNPVADFANSVLNAPIPKQAPDNGYAAGLPPAGVPIPAQQPQPLPVAATMQEPVSTAAPSAAPVHGGGGAPAPAAAVPVDPLNDPAVKAADQRINASEQVANAAAGEKLAVDNAAAVTDERNRQATEAQTKLQQQHEDRTAAEQRVTDLRNKAANFQYHNFFHDKTAGQMILAGLGILAGGVSYDPHHINQASEIIQNGIKQDFAKQEAQHKQLWQDVESAMQQGRQLSEDQLREMGDFRATQALKLDAVAAKGKELVAANKAHGETLALKQHLQQLEFTRDQALDEATRLHQAAQETRRHNRAEEGIGYAHVAVARNKAAGEQSDAQTLKVTALVNNTLKNKATPELIKKRDTLESVVSAIDSGNPVAKGAALDEFTKAATGLGARPSSVRLFENRVGGTFEHFKSILQKAQNGDPLTPEQTKRFRSAADFILQDTKQRLSEERKAHQTALLQNPVFAKHEDVLNAAFDNIYGPETPAAPAAAAPAAGGIQEGVTATGPGGKRIIFRGGQWQAL